MMTIIVIIIYLLLFIDYLILECNAFNKAYSNNIKSYINVIFYP